MEEELVKDEKTGKCKLVKVPARVIKEYKFLFDNNKEMLEDWKRLYGRKCAYRQEAKTLKEEREQLHADLEALRQEAILKEAEIIKHKAAIVQHNKDLIIAQEHNRILYEEAARKRKEDEDKAARVNSKGLHFTSTPNTAPLAIEAAMPPSTEDEVVEEVKVEEPVKKERKKRVKKVKTPEPSESSEYEDESEEEKEEVAVVENAALNLVEAAI